MTGPTGTGANILITGAGGFIGQALAEALLQEPTTRKILLTDVAAPKLPSAPSGIDGKRHCQIDAVAADLTSPPACQDLLAPDLTHIYLLHGIMSGAAEANLDLGLRVNVDSMRHILDVVRTRDNSVRVVFPSSLAVFGPAKNGTVVSEATMPLPQSSYGAEKAMVEILLNDFSRRGLVDARIVRLPTIIVRPGKPTGAASSFCSGIIREPLNGQVATLPVSQDLKLWVCSARTVIRNLVIAGTSIHPEAFEGHSRVVNLPGVTVSVKQMLDALVKVHGREALDLVREEHDEDVSKIVVSWPSEFDITRARELGFRDDVSLEQTLRDYIEDYMS